MKKLYSLLQKNSVETSFGRLYYYDSDPSGSLPPLLMTHGLGSNGQSFFLLALFFTSKRRVVIPDLFQFSGLSHTTNRKPLSIAQHAQSIEELCRYLKLDTLDMCGLSMGGWITIWLAIHNPTLVKSVTLINPGGVALRASDLRERLLSLNKPRFEEMYNSMIHSRWLRQTPILSDLTKKVIYQGLSHQNVRDFVELIGENDLIDDKLSQVKRPTLLLWGVEDRFLPSEVPYVLMKELIDIRGYFIFNAGHIPSIETPATVYCLMSEFLGIDEFSHPLLRKLAKRLLLPQQTMPIVVGGMSELDLSR